MPEISLVLVLSGAALLAGVLPMARLAFRINLNATMFLSYIRKLLDSGNLDRAIKLSAAAPASPLARGVNAMLKAYASRITDALDLKDTFERGAGGLSRTIFGWTWMSWLALALLTAATVLAGSRGFDLRAWEIGVGLAALLITLSGIRMAYKILNQAVAAREELLRALQDLALNR
jgi:hypothetical protein